MPFSTDIYSATEEDLTAAIGDLGTKLQERSGEDAPVVATALAVHLARAAVSLLCSTGVSSTEAIKLIGRCIAEEHLLS